MVNIGYAWGQLVRARRAGATADVAKWERVIANLERGVLDVGSRTPTEAPAWVTLEVATGGFATGSYLAGGPLRDHERSLAASRRLPATRRALNQHFLMSADADKLLASGRYRIDVPEEGALLVVAWLSQCGDFDASDAIVAAIEPWFDTLRFYPVPADDVVAPAEMVRLQSVAATIAQLDTTRRQLRLDAMQKSLRVWQPLRRRAIALLAEPPGAADRDARVARLVADFGRAGKPTTHRAREVAWFVEHLTTPPEQMPGQIRHRVARYIAAHGMPGTPAHDARAAAELDAVAAPLHADLRHVLVERLRALRPDGGVDFDAACAPIAPDEAAAFAVPAGTAIPAHLQAKVARSEDASLADLVARRVIVSSEMLAGVLPQLTSRARAATLASLDARRLYSALYQAFRRRRGLLLLNYEHQVRFGELPWVAALEAARAPGDASPVVASVAGVALRGFPYTIVPNKLVTELTALAPRKLPLVEELAADIFMGSFTAKFVEAAQVSARLMAGTLYARYYAIDTDELLRLPIPRKTSPELAAICARRAGGGSGVARNGKILEQAQILTTHNLAVLFDAFDLRAQLADELWGMAETCWCWAMRRLQRAPLRLAGIKNAAYAWRQLVFYASFLDARRIADRTRTVPYSQSGAFSRRFEPALRGLELAASGISSADPQFTALGGRVFTGWSTDRHWLA